MNANAPHFNAEAIDNTIDRALSALRDAQPRSGLEGRVLASLEHRAAAPQPARFHFSAHVALWTAASAAVLAIASLIILHQHAARPQPQIRPRPATPGATPGPALWDLGSGSRPTSIEPTRRMAPSSRPRECLDAGSLRSIRVPHLMTTKSS